MIAISTTTTGIAHRTGMRVTVMTPTPMYPATTARSPCARLTTFMTPNISDRPHANSAYRPPVSTPWMMALTQAMTAPIGGAEVGGLHLLPGDLRGRALQRGVPLEQALQVGGDPQRLADVLLDEQHGDAGLEHLRQGGVDALHDDRCQPEGQLVEQQHPGVGDQRPADRDRLLP